MSFKVERNDKVGRYAVASRDLEPGETFLEELPIAVGPKSCSPLLCLGCYTYVDGSILCSQCRWPICSSECGLNPLHAEAECKVFSSAKVTFQLQEDPSAPSPQFECITPLRVLLVKESDPERWEREVGPMESHCKERKAEQEWNTEQVNIVDFLLKKCKLNDRFNDELIHFVCGVLETNCFEVKTDNGKPIRGLYPQLAILSHNCVANTTHSVIPQNDYRVYVRTTIKVQAGQELFSSYTYSIAPTLTRRANLRFTKYFDCNCKRCSDPTELGTHMSSLKCTKCDNGLILSTAPLDPEAKWNCNSCEFHLTADQVKRIYKLIESEIEQLESLPMVDYTIEQGEKILRQYRSVLHPKHAFNTSIRHSLVQLYGRANGYTFEDLPDILLERKIELCEQILSVINVIEPGYSRIRGLNCMWMKEMKISV
ncbi:SET domain-containing protein SmydA-8-like isoform X2 [Lycorma delicatula]|uniref:SET domain-containing protein SmydA-8-like isoform X2 n=1 Tax=Lycorma delicatula TaxID=130591 RepID=UPI003F511484